MKLTKKLYYISRVSILRAKLLLLLMLIKRFVNIFSQYHVCRLRVMLLPGIALPSNRMWCKITYCGTFRTTSTRPSTRPEPLRHASRHAPWNSEDELWRNALRFIESQCFALKWLTVTTLSFRERRLKQSVANGTSQEETFWIKLEYKCTV